MLHTETKSHSDKLVYLKNYPVQELWRLFVPGKYHQKNKGWFDLEKENKERLKSTFNAFAMALSNLSKPISMDFIKDIHKIAAQDLAKTEAPFDPYRAYEDQDEDESFTPGKLRIHPMRDIVGYRLYEDTITQNGIEELLNKIESQTDFPKYHGAWLGFGSAPHIDFRSAIYTDSIKIIREKREVKTNAELAAQIFAEAKPKKLSYLAPRAGEVFEATFKKLIDDFHQQMDTCNDASNKLEIISGLITDLYQLHPFQDGNTRTIPFILLNFLLTQQGLPIATFENIDVYKGHSKVEALKKLNLAMTNSLRLIEGEKNLFDFVTSENISNEQQDQYLIKVASLKEVILSDHPASVYTETLKVSQSESPPQESVKEDQVVTVQVTSSTQNIAEEDQEATIQVPPSGITPTLVSFFSNDNSPKVEVQTVDLLVEPTQSISSFFKTIDSAAVIAALRNDLQKHLEEDDIKLHVFQGGVDRNKPILTFAAEAVSSLFKSLKVVANKYDIYAYEYSYSRGYDDGHPKNYRLDLICPPQLQFTELLNTLSDVIKNKKGIQIQ
jgi:hypothetical protein